MSRIDNLKGAGFKPGISGNPNGRPPAAKDTEELRKQIRDSLQDCFDTVLEIMRDPKVHAAYRLTAANSLLDRGLGKAIPSNGLPEGGVTIQVFTGIPRPPKDAKVPTILEGENAY